MDVATCKRSQCIVIGLELQNGRVCVFFRILIRITLVAEDDRIGRRLSVLLADRVEQVANYFVTDRRHANLLTRAHECTDHLRADIRLPGTWWPLNRERC